MRRLRWAVPAIAIVLAGALLLARRHPSAQRWLGGRPRNLLVVTLDTLRADRVGSYGHGGARTPRLDGLAAGGLRFARATTVTPLTLPAHASLFTGTFPARHGVRDNGGYYLGDDQDTLAEVLKARGFRTGGFVSAFVLDSRWGIAQGFDRYFDDFDLSRFDSAPGMDAIQRPGQETVDRAIAWLQEDGERPFFLWVHLYDPHTPYAAPPEWARHFPATLQGAYDAEIAFADAQLGRLLDAVQAQERLDETVVAVLADHGEMLGEHAESTHGFFVYEAAVRIPMVMAGPGLRAAAIEDQVRIVDVMPTALELLRVPAPAAVQGTSLLPLAEGRRLNLLAVAESWFPRFHYGWSELVSIQDERFKLIRAPRPELYDLRHDPGELNDLSASDPRQVETLSRALDEMLARLGGSRASAPQAMDAETAERLEALGYIGGGVSARHLEDRPRGDPKDKIHLYNLLRQATTASAEGRYEQAIAMAHKALAQDPAILEGHMVLGNFLRKAGRQEEAAAAYRRALALDPEHQQSTFSLALVYKDTGRLADARLGFERVQQLDRRSGRAVLQLADLDMLEGRPEAGEARLQEALKGPVERPPFLLKLGECYIGMKRWDDAARALTEAIAASPGLQTAHFNLGLVREEQGRLEEAVAGYRRELELNPKAYRAGFNLAKLLDRGGRRSEAAALYARVVSLAPDFAIGRLYLSKALLDTGNLAGAEREAREALRRRPDPKFAPLGHYVLADVFNRQGRFAAARQQRAVADRLAAAARQ